MTDYLRFLLALAVVLGLIMLFAWIIRRFRLGGLAGSALGSGRLEVIETLPIDGRQRLVLIRCDDHEHLLLVGQERSAVIESGISVIGPGPEAVDTAPRLSMSS
ncbi:MAG: flagellar biosynthetic protein FliO [Geminicoccaceae bacterium]